MPSMTTLRALFISDAHLGTRGCQAELLIDFLRWHDAETIYLVGDIIDGWRLKRSWFWPQSHNEVMQILLEKLRNGTNIVYLPGNHDEFLRDYDNTEFGDIKICNTAIHVTATGERLLVIHGDQFDIVVRHARWLALMGDWAYEAALLVNTYFNRARRRLGFSYWSLSAWIKGRVKNAVTFIGAYEEAVSRAARERDADGVVCGHIHQAANHRRYGIRYLNCGDWVESCTALGEHQDGRFEIISWTELAERVESRPGRARYRVVGGSRSA